MMIEGHPNPGKRGVALEASGIMDIIAGQSLYVLGAHFSEKQKEGTKNMLIAIGDRTTKFVVEVTGEENLSTPRVVQQSEKERNEKKRNYAPINTVHYKAEEDREIPRVRHKNFVTDQAIQAANDWRDEDQIAEKYETYRGKILKMLEEFEQM